MIYISEQQVLDALTMPKAIELVDQAFRQLAAGTAINHPRRRLILPSGSILHYMAGGNPDYFGIKVYSSNPKTGAHFQFLLYRTSDGMPLATIEANHLGQIRTGAASGVATRYLARQDAGVLGIIGSGFQAETQIAALSNVRNFHEIRIWSRNPARRKEFAQKCAEKFGLNIIPAETGRQAVEGAHVVVTATNSKDPVLESAWISPGTHINAMGSNQATRREIPADLVHRADLIVVDSVEQARMEAGDLLLAFEEKDWTELRVVELKDLAGRPARTASQITLFKSIGRAIEDVIAAGYVYQRALEANRGTRIPNHS